MERKPIPGITEPDWAKRIVKTLFSVYKPKKRGVVDWKVGAVEEPFGEAELSKAAKGLKPGKAPRPDGVPNEILTLVVAEWPELFLETYNACLREGSFPIR